MSDLTHVDERGQLKMVDVGGKDPTVRIAQAEALVRTRPDVLQLIQERKLAKGDVLATAKIAGIQAAKKTPDLIPLCHPLLIDQVSIDLRLGEDSVHIHTQVRCQGRTGVEMEALTAASVTALTLYDMCKAVDKAMSIEFVRLVSKSGGKSGHFERSSDGVVSASRQGRLQAICLSQKKGVAKKQIAQARLLHNHGLEGDAHAGQWHRQVSLLAHEQIEQMRQQGLTLEPGAFGENLVTQGLDLGQLKVGDRVCIGQQVQLIVTQLGKECHNPCAIYHQVGHCIMPTQGVFARVICAGEIRQGDQVRLVPKQSERVCIVGRSGHGKTTLLEALIKELVKRGLRVGAIKHSGHQHELDKPGKDSYRHRQAGARPNAIITTDLVAAYTPLDEGLSGDAWLTPLFRDCDLVLVEGYRRGPGHNIEMFRAELGETPLALQSQDIEALVTSDPIQVDIPIWPLHDIPILVDRLLAYLAGAQQPSRARK